MDAALIRELIPRVTSTAIIASKTTRSTVRVTRAVLEGADFCTGMNLVSSIVCLSFIY